jgi:hypothetical protein
MRSVKRALLTYRTIVLVYGESAHDAAMCSTGPGLG